MPYYMEENKIAMSLATAWRTLTKGWWGPNGDNETELISTIPDPTKHRQGVLASVVESNLGGHSYNTVRSDGTNDEYVLTMGRLTADKLEGAYYIACRRRDGQEVREVFYIDPNAAIIRAPLTASLDILTSRNDKYRLVLQNDGNIVGYRQDGSVFWASNTNE